MWPLITIMVVRAGPRSSCGVRVCGQREGGGRTVRSERWHTSLENRFFLGEILISLISTNIRTGFEWLESKWFLRNSSPIIHKPEKHLKAMRQSLLHGFSLLLIIEMKSSIFLRIRREIALVGLLPVRWLKEGRGGKIKRYIFIFVFPERIVFDSNGFGT